MKQSRARSKSAKSDRWIKLTWHDLEAWAGKRSVERGRDYQRGGRVRGLTISAKGHLLATVSGGEEYATEVWCRKKPKQDSDTLDSRCTCPVGGVCKHAVAVVAEYLGLIADGTQVPEEKDDDPRRAKLDGDGEDEYGSDEDANDDERSDEDDEDADDSEYDDAGEGFEDDDSRRPKTKAQQVRDKKSGANQQTGKKKVSAESRIRRYYEAQSRDELLALVVSITLRFPELQTEILERLDLASGDAARLLSLARREIHAITGKPGWRNSWEGEGFTPDFGPVTRRLERLVELGHCDAAAELGRELIACGLAQVEQSQDEGETAMALGESLPIVFEAVAKSSMTNAEKVLFAIDAELEDGCDALGDAASKVLSGNYAPSDWSLVADEMARRLASYKPSAGHDTRDYRRDAVSGYLAMALELAGRSDEVRSIYEREARQTQSYERLVNYLIQHNRLDEAETWAAEGIEKTREKLPGIANSLARLIGELAVKQQWWDVAAAFAAERFFDNPCEQTLDELLVAARRAKKHDAVRDSAMEFLETGVMPIRVESSSKGVVSATAAPDWPLPIPRVLVPLMRRIESPSSRPRPHYDVLINIAITKKQPDDVLKWYDRWRAGEKGAANRWGSSASSHAESVARAVAKSHPERALAIYGAKLEERLQEAGGSAYDACAGYLRLMKPIFAAMKAEDQWVGLVGEIRVKYKNRPKFMETLDGLDDRPIVETPRRRGAGSRASA